MIKRLRHHNLLTASQGEQTDQLEPLPDRSELEHLIIQVLTEHREFNQSDLEDILLMKALADAIFEYWRAYRERNEPSMPSKNTHTRSRMRRFYYSNNR